MARAEPVAAGMPMNRDYGPPQFRARQTVSLPETKAAIHAPPAWPAWPARRLNMRVAEGVSTCFARWEQPKAGSIHAHLVQASTNDPIRHHHPATNATDDLLVKVGSREYWRHQPGVGPASIHQPGRTQIAGAGGAMVTVDEEDDDAGAAVDAAPAGSTQFALEKDLPRYLIDHLQRIEPGPFRVSAGSFPGLGLHLAPAIGFIIQVTTSEGSHAGAVLAAIATVPRHATAETG